MTYQQTVQEGGASSQFILYDKPELCHLTHFGVVTEVDRDRRLRLRM